MWWRECGKFIFEQKSLSKPVSLMSKQYILNSELISESALHHRLQFIL